MWTKGLVLYYLSALEGHLRPYLHHDVRLICQGIHHHVLALQNLLNNEVNLVSSHTIQDEPDGHIVLHADLVKIATLGHHGTV